MRAYRTVAWLAVSALVAAACSGTSLPTTTTEATTTTVAVTTMLGGRVSLIPNSAPFIREGERGAYVEALQFYLVCTDHGEPTPGAQVSVDGAYGPITADAVAYYQAELRRVPSGDPDEDTFASLARDCAQDRTLTFAEGAFTGEFAGNVDVGDPETFTFTGAGGQVLGFDLLDGVVTIAVSTADGTPVETTADGTRIEAELETAQAYTIRIEATTPTSYRIGTSLRSPNVVASEFGPMKLEDDGIAIAQFGDDPINTVAVIALLLGNPSDDTGWDEDPTCTGKNRHVTWLIQGDPAGSSHPAYFVADFTDTGGTPYFSQYAYISENLAALDPLSRGLTTPEGITLGSTYDQFVEAYDIPDFLDTTLGLADEAGFHFGFSLIGGATDPDGTATKVWMVGAGADGCPDA